MILYVNEIKEVNLPTNSPASINRATGQLFINKNVFSKLPPQIQDFILLHEEGHYNLQTKDELLADHYASNRFLGSQKLSLKSSIKALENILPDNELSKKRIENQYLRALVYDYVVFGNKKSKKNYLIA